MLCNMKSSRAASLSSGFYHRGFSLVELAIALVIIGLIIGGVLVGNDLVKGAEVRGAVHQTQLLQAGYVTFKDKYRCIPGDCEHASRALEGAVNGDGNKMISCSEADPMCTASTNEHIEAFNQMQQAGLVRAGVSPDNTFMNAKINECQFFIFEHLFSTTDRYNTGTGNYLWVTQHTGDGLTNRDCLTPQQAYNFDEKFDDGRPGTGKVLGLSHSGLSHEECASEPHDAGRQPKARYNTLNENVGCTVFIQLD